MPLGMMPNESWWSNDRARGWRLLINDDIGSPCSLLAPWSILAPLRHFWLPRSTSGSPVFLTPKSHFWLPLLVLSLKISLSPAQMATSSCNEVKQLPRYRTKDVAYTQSGLHLEAWFTPPVVAYTQNDLLEAWFTPPAVAYTQNGLHLEAWFTPLVVAYTQNGLHHRSWRTPKVVYTSRRGSHHHPWRTPKVVYTQGDLWGPQNPRIARSRQL